MSFGLNGTVIREREKRHLKRSLKNSSNFEFQLNGENLGHHKWKYFLKLSALKHLMKKIKVPWELCNL